jgi:hypothetical protein
VSLRLEPQESVFVVFRPDRENPDRVVSVQRDGRSVWPRPVQSPVQAKIAIQKAIYGIPGDAARTRDVRAKLQAIVDGGERRIAAWRLGEGDDPAMQALKTLRVDYTLHGSPRKISVLDGQSVCLDDSADPPPEARIERTADGTGVRLEAWQNGSYELKTSEGKKWSAGVHGLPAPQAIDGPWDVQFPVNSGVPQSVKLDKLISWSDHGNPGVKYFSGTATYRTTFRVPPESLGAGRAAYLDLGEVAVIAQPILNGRDLGIEWNRPFRVDATEALRPGENSLEVRVTNLWVNRMIGDEQLPEDSERNPDGLLKSWPKWLVEGKPSPAGRRTFATYRVWKKDSPLQESGLLGPVRMYTTQRIVPGDSSATGR